MDDQRVGGIVRALRRRLGWRQKDLAAKAGCSQGLVSLVERGHLDRVSVHRLRLILAAVGASMMVEVRWRAGALDRLLDEDHAALVARVAAMLRAAGWLVETEVTYSEFGERGSYDLIALHPRTGVLLAIEVKTDLSSAEATLRKLDEKVRLAARVAEKRFGWRVRSVARVLVFNETSTLRRRVARHRDLFDEAFPMRNVEFRQWLGDPRPARGALLFLPANTSSRASRSAGGPERVRVPRSPSDASGGIAA